MSFYSNNPLFKHFFLIDFLQLTIINVIVHFTFSLIIRCVEDFVCLLFGKSIGLQLSIGNGFGSLLSG